MEEVWSAVHNAGRNPQAHCRLQTSETEMSTAPWRRMVWVFSYAHRWGTFTFTFTLHQQGPGQTGSSSPVYI